MSAVETTRRSNCSAPPETLFHTTTWSPDSDIRGTVIALPGRSEHAGTFTQLAERLEVDGYRVVGVDSWNVDALAAEETAERLARALAGVAADQPAPVVALGADTGGLLATLFARQCEQVRAVVAGGIPTYGDGVDLAAGVAEAGLRDPGVPALVLQGEADTLSPSLAVRRVVTRWHRCRFAQVADTGHDVFNGKHRRSVHAEIVQFLERVRSSSATSPLLRVSIRSSL